MLALRIQHPKTNGTAQSSNRQSGLVHLLLILIIFILAGFGAYYYFQNSKVNRRVEKIVPLVQAQNATEVIPDSPKPGSLNATYKNLKYGYSFDYLKDYHVFISEPDFVFVKKQKEDDVVLMNVVAKHSSTLVYPNPENFVSKITNLKDVSFEKFTSEALLAECAVLDVDQEYYCNKVVTQEPYTNLNDLVGYKVFLNLVHAARDRNSKRETLAEATWGPIYILDITDRNIPDVRALVFKPQLDLKLDTNIADLEIKKIVDTVKF